MSHPNFLIFCTDQQRADHLGCAGAPALRTPNLDAMAARGVRFTSAYCASPACMCARATMLTGLSNRGNNMRQHGMGLPEDIPTLAGLLAGAGYRTHSAGKLHLKPWGRVAGVTFEDIETPQTNPERRQLWVKYGVTRSPDNYYGFQTQDMVIGHGDYSAEGGDYAVWLRRTAPDEAAKYTRGGPIDVAPSLHYNTWIADRAIDFLKDQSLQAPFFLWCSFPDPHEPFAALRDYADLYDERDMPLGPSCLQVPNRGQSRTLAAIGHGTAPLEEATLRAQTRQTFGMITHVDEQIGRVLSCLQTQGLAENTVVMLISDHGEQLGEHGLMHKGFWPYDGSTRIPFIVDVPWAKPSSHGRTVDEVVSQIDLVPTVLDLAGVPHPEDPRSTPAHREAFPQLPDSLPGESLKPVLLDQARPRRGTALIEFGSDGLPPFDLLQMRTLVTKDHKLVMFSPTRELLLFDRGADPHEMLNVADDPSYAGALRDMLVRMIHETQCTEPRLPRRFSQA